MVIFFLFKVIYYFIWIKDKIYKFKVLIKLFMYTTAGNQLSDQVLFS